MTNVWGIDGQWERILNTFGAISLTLSCNIVPHKIIITHTLIWVSLVYSHYARIGECFTYSFASWRACFIIYFVVRICRTQWLAWDTLLNPIITKLTLAFRGQFVSVQITIQFFSVRDRITIQSTKIIIWWDPFSICRSPFEFVLTNTSFAIVMNIRFGVFNVATINLAESLSLIPNKWIKRIITKFWYWLTSQVNVVPPLITILTKASIFFCFKKLLSNCPLSYIFRTVSIAYFWVRIIYLISLTCGTWLIQDVFTIK